MNVDVIVAGAGVAGLLIASEMSSKLKVIVIEQNNSIPRHKYWLTNQAAAAKNPELKSCIDCLYDSMDFIAYDETRANVQGPYVLWDTEKLTTLLLKKIRSNNAKILTGHRFYSYSENKNTISARVGSITINTKLLVDCMGYGSPIATAKGLVDITGFFVLTGRTLRLKKEIVPVGLHNVILSHQPTYLELFPSNDLKAHATMIAPTRNWKHDTVNRDFNFVIGKSHYSEYVEELPSNERQGLHGIIPVGKLNAVAIDRIYLFGESGQANPATSATGLTRMLYTFKELSSFLIERVSKNELTTRNLRRSKIEMMSGINRHFQEVLFKSLLNFRSDKFKQLIAEMDRLPDQLVNDLIFADYRVQGGNSLNLLTDFTRHPNSIIARQFTKTILQSLLKMRS